MSVKSHNRYTPQDLLLIRRLVSENPGNLSEAFRKAATELGREPNAVKQQWYLTVSKTNTTFVIYNKECDSVNKKNSSTTKKQRHSFFSYLKKLIFKSI